MLRRGSSVVRKACQALPALTSSSTDQAVVTQHHITSPFQFDDTQGNSYGGSTRMQSYRNFSLFSGSAAANTNTQPVEGQLEGDGAPLSLPTEDATAAAATTAASAAAPLSDTFTPASIFDVVGGAEAEAMLEATEGTWAPTRALIWILDQVHTGTGLDWWQSIALTTVGMRLSTFPLMLMTIKNTHRLSQARPEIEKLLEHMKEEQARGNTNAAAEHQQRVMQVWAKYNANPIKSLASLFVQAPLFIGFFSALRALSATKVPSFVEGGAFWFTDLTVADPYYALPVLASLSFLLTVELGGADGMEGQPDATKQKLKNIMRGVAIIIVPFTLNMPAGVFMYWITSNLFSLGQTMVLKVPGVKKVLGIPLKMASTNTVVGSDGKVTLGKPVPTFAQKPPGKKGSGKKLN